MRIFEELDDFRQFGLIDLRIETKDQVLIKSEWKSNFFPVCKIKNSSAALRDNIYMLFDLFYTADNFSFFVEIFR